MKIKTLQGALNQWDNALRDRQIQTLERRAVNKNRDRIYRTKLGIFYVKYQREPKMKDEYEQGTIYYTINKELVDKHKFHWLIIINSKGKVYMTDKQKILEAIEQGFVRETESQGEEVVNVPIEDFWRF